MGFHLEKIPDPEGGAELSIRGGERLTFHLVAFYDRLGFVTIAISFFVLAHITVELSGEEKRIVATKVQGLLPTRVDLRVAWKPIVRQGGVHVEQ
jgi:TctA family transporter